MLLFSVHPTIISSPSPAAAESIISQLGGDIDGEAAGDESGFSVSLNGDGTRVAIGAHLNAENGAISGHTRIFEYNSSSSSWVQLGADIDGEAAGDASGYSVSLSSDGTRVAIGAPNNDGNGTDSGRTRVYEWNGTAWTQVGDDIDGEAAFDQSGASVSINSDGTRVAIGAPTNSDNGASSGHTRIYQYNSSSSSWVQLGADIDGEADGDTSGFSVSLNSDGSRVAIGATANDGNGTDAGHTRIFEYNSSSSSWVQLGADIDGEAAGDISGHSVSLNGDGTRVAIGAPLNAENGAESGHTRIFEYNSSSSSWVQLGADIDSEAAGDKSGWSVSLSSDGTRVAIAAPTNDGNGTTSGHARIFEYNSSSSSWVQLGADIDGEAAGDALGDGLSLNSDGTRVAIGAVINDGNASDAGHTRIFAINAVSQSSERESGAERDSAEHPGEPGIFLTLTGQAFDPSQGFGVTFGAYAVAPNSPFVLAIRDEQSGIQRVLASGTTSAGGHLEDSIQLPQLQTGSYTITLTARSAGGALLPLGNRILVDGQGNIQSVSPEEFQPRIR